MLGAACDAFKMLFPGAVQKVLEWSLCVWGGGIGIHACLPVGERDTWAHGFPRLRFEEDLKNCSLRNQRLYDVSWVELMAVICSQPRWADRNGGSMEVMIIRQGRALIVGTSRHWGCKAASVQVCNQRRIYNRQPAAFCGFNRLWQL